VKATFLIIFSFFLKNKGQIRAIQVINHLNQVGVGSMLMMSILGYSFISFVWPIFFAHLSPHSLHKLKTAPLKFEQVHDPFRPRICLYRQKNKENF